MRGSYHPLNYSFNVYKYLRIDQNVLVDHERTDRHQLSFQFTFIDESILLIEEGDHGRAIMTSVALCRQNEPTSHTIDLESSRKMRIHTWYLLS